MYIALFEKLFQTCEHTLSLWTSICPFMLDSISSNFILCLKDVLFGFAEFERQLDLKKKQLL